MGQDVKHCVPQIAGAREVIHRTPGSQGSDWMSGCIKEFWKEKNAFQQREPYHRPGYTEADRSFHTHDFFFFFF